MKIHYQNYLRNLKNNQKSSIGRKGGERRIELYIKLPNQAKPIKSDFMESTLFIEIKESWILPKTYESYLMSHTV